MTTFRIAAIALIAMIGTAHAQSQQEFQGIEGEVLPQPSTETAPLISDTQGFSFEIGKASPTESSVITERGSFRNDFYRSTIHSGRRAGASGTTGLNLIDKLFDLD